MTGYDGENHVPGGYILLARKIRESEIWAWSSDQIRFFLYLLLEARWDPKPRRVGEVTIQRGQVLKSFRKISEENEFTDNRQVRRWSTSTVKRMVDRLREAEMVSTHGTELGTLFTITNFSVYQDPERYSLELGTEPGTHLEQVRNNRKKDKKDNTPPGQEFEALRERYSESQLTVLDQTFDAIRSTRKTGRVADTILLREMRYWAGFEPEEVVQACHTYLEKGYASEGKREEYLRGILRGLARDEAQPTTGVQPTIKLQPHPYRRLS